MSSIIEGHIAGIDATEVKAKAGAGPEALGDNHHATETASDTKAVKTMAMTAGGLDVTNTILRGTTGAPA